MRGSGVAERLLTVSCQSGCFSGYGPFDARNREDPSVPLEDTFGCGSGPPLWVDCGQTGGGWRGFEGQTPQPNKNNNVRVGGFNAQVPHIAMHYNWAFDRSAPLATLVNPDDIGPGMQSGYNEDEGWAFKYSVVNRTGELLDSLFPGHEFGQINNFGRDHPNPETQDVNVDSVAQGLETH